MSAAATIVDYGMGNLLSVQRAFEHCGASVALCADPAAIEAAERLVLPGVGAFRDGMDELQTRRLIEPIRRFAASGRPFLGICLGMQMMFEAGEEHGEHAGLALLRGRVVVIPGADAAGRRRKIPHIGWNALNPADDGAGWTGTILEGAIPGQTSVYFVHSYHACPRSNSECLALTDYQGFAVTAAVARANLCGCQFHPEKSGEAGLRIIRNFLGMGSG